MKTKLLIVIGYFFSLPLLVASSPNTPADPYNHVVYVTNSVTWPYEAQNYGVNSFRPGQEDEQDEDALLFNSMVRNGFHFPANFAFGVAGSAYQYEGNRIAPSANNLAGIGWSIWDVFCEKNSWLNPNGTNILEVAPTSNVTTPNGAKAIQGFDPTYYQQDIELTKQLGVDYYRLSISWPRLFPRPNMKKPDPAGIKYYQDVLAQLQKKHIKVLITLYHWDMPAWLYNYGDEKAKIKTYGWLDMSDAKDNLPLKEFQKYVAASYEAFGQFTPYFSTFNEPLTFTNSALTEGVHAPGQYGWEHLRQKNPNLYGSDKTQNLQRLPYLQAINIIKAHYIAYKTIHYLYEKNTDHYPKPQVSIVLNADWAEPYRIECDEKKQHCHYARGDIQASKNNMDYMLGWWLDPVMFGRWPNSLDKLIYSPLGRIKTVGIDARDSSCLQDNGVPVSCGTNNARQETLADYISSGGALDLVAINHYTGYFAVDIHYAREHFSPTYAPGAIPPDQYNHSPTTLKEGWYTDQNAFLTQFRYDKYLYSGMENEQVPQKDRIYVIGNAGNKPWLRQTWFAYRKLLQYINFYYLHDQSQRVKMTKSKIKFQDLEFYLTENGTSIYQESQQNLRIDHNRINYLLGNLAAVQQAVNDDHIHVKLYTYWSLADNFEWSEGYDSRFGLIEIDYANNFKRTPKQSYYCLQQIIRDKNKGIFPEKCLYE